MCIDWIIIIFVQLFVVVIDVDGIVFIVMLMILFLSLYIPQFVVVKIR